jgi:hypothetical protein
VAASRSLVALHASFTGTHHVRLPRAATVTDAMTGAVIAKGATTFAVSLRLGQTGIWLVK